MAGEGDDLGDRINHLAGPRFLFHFAVLAQRYFEVADLDFAVNEWSHWRVGVERFTARKLLFGLLQVAIADIEPDGVTENVVGRG